MSARRLLVHEFRVRHVLALRVHGHVCRPTGLIATSLPPRSRRPIQMLCTFCRCVAREFAEGPDVAICDQCLGKAEVPAADLTPGLACSFCGKAPRRSRFSFRRRALALVSGAGEARICTVCVPIAREVIEQKRKSDAP